MQLKIIGKIWFKIKSIIWNSFASILVFFGLACREKKSSVFSEEELKSRQWYRHKQFVDFLKSQNLLTGKLLDVGCGKMELLCRIKMQGTLESLDGCDWLPENENRNNHEIKYKQVDLNKNGLSDYPDHYFDLVIASEVFEHLENPLFLFNEIHKKLKPTGIFVFSVPNAINLYERMCFLMTGNSNRYQIEKPGEFGHITFFTTNIIKSLAARAGFKLIREGGGYMYISGYFFFPKILFSPLFSYSAIYLLEKTSE